MTIDPKTNPTLTFDTWWKAHNYVQSCRDEGVAATRPRWVDPRPHPAGGIIRGGWAVTTRR